jgi:hypothetical protein
MAAVIREPTDDRLEGPRGREQLAEVGQLRQLVEPGAAHDAVLPDQEGGAL